MKEKIILFATGILIGTIIATGSFYIYTTMFKSCDINSDNIQMNSEQRPDMYGRRGGFDKQADGSNSEEKRSPERHRDNDTQDDSQNEDK